jgi:catechol 2,3-dioxygenase-like lactoylglutathione lyase family enzyme
MTLSLHHAHLLASDIEATIEFWTRAFAAIVVYDEYFAGARNVFLTVGAGWLHLYDQPPKASATNPTADYAMAMGPDELLIEIFRPNPAAVPNHLRRYFNLPDTQRDDKDPA